MKTRYLLDEYEMLEVTEYLDTINILWIIEGNYVPIKLLNKSAACVIALIGTDNYISMLKNRFGNLMARQTIEDLMRLSRHIAPVKRKDWENQLNETYESKILFRDMDPDYRDFYNQIGIEE